MRNRDLRPAAKANPTIQQAFERFQKYNRLKNLSQGSLDFYAAKGRSFFRFLGDTEQPITTITEETVEDYIFYMKDQQLHDTTINTNLRMVRAFLYWCMEKGYLDKYPIRLVRADDPIKEPYTTGELQKLLKEPDCKTCSFAEYRMGDEEKRWPFDGFYLKLAEAQREYEQEQHIDPASLTEEERQQKLQEILDWITASRKKKKDTDEQLDPIVPEEEPETAGATPQPAKQYITDLVGEDYKNWHGIVVLDAGTNSGKTYFILKTLLPWAYEHRKRILILCNREALRNQIERDVNRLGRIEAPYEDYDPALGGIVYKTATDNKYEYTIRVETYQWLETFLQRNEDAAKTYLRSFDYIVSDEYHYMVTDASFNDHVDASYEAIKELWTTKTCIFMSATARPFFDYWVLRKMIPEGQHYRLPMDYRFVSSVKFFYRDDDELDIIRRVQPGEKILVFVNTIAKLRKLRDTLKADGIEDVACLCSKYRQEAEEFDKLDDVLVGNVLQHQVTLTTTTLYNGVDMKDRALKYIVSELWNPLVNAQILGRKRPLDEGDTCAVYLLHYPKERLEGKLKKIEKYQLEPVEAYRKWFDDTAAFSYMLGTFFSGFRRR